MILLIYLVIALLVVFAWSFLFLRRDKFEPEPRGLLIKLFLVGAIPVVLLAGIANELLGLVVDDGWVVILGAPVNEEALKLGALFLVAFGSRHFTQTVDGAIYGISIGLGFAAAENVTYALNLGPAALGYRSLLVPLMHPLFTGISGYYLGRYKFEQDRMLIWRGLAIAVLLHAIWNSPGGLAELLGSSEVAWTQLLVIPIVIFVLVRFLKRMSSPDAQKIRELLQVTKPQPGPTGPSPGTAPPESLANP